MRTARRPIAAIKQYVGRLTAHRAPRFHGRTWARDSPIENHPARHRSGPARPPSARIHSRLRRATTHPTAALVTHMTAPRTEWPEPPPQGQRSRSGVQPEKEREKVTVKQDRAAAPPARTDRCTISPEIASPPPEAPRLHWITASAAARPARCGEPVPNIISSHTSSDSCSHPRADSPAHRTTPPTTLPLPAARAIAAEHATLAASPPSSSTAIKQQKSLHGSRQVFQHQRRRRHGGFRILRRCCYSAGAFAAMPDEEISVLTPSSTARGDCAPQRSRRDAGKRGCDDRSTAPAAAPVRRDAPPLLFIPMDCGPGPETTAAALQSRLPHE